MGCLSLLPPHQLRPSSHLLLKNALKMNQSVFSQSSQGPLGPHQGSVFLAKAQLQQQCSRNERSPSILLPRQVAGIISPILEMGKPGPGLSFVTCPWCHDESAEEALCSLLPLFPFPLEKRRVRKKNCHPWECRALLWKGKGYSQTQWFQPNLGWGWRKMRMGVVVPRILFLTGLGPPVVELGQCPPSFSSYYFEAKTMTKVVMVVVVGMVVYVSWFF